MVRGRYRKREVYAHGLRSTAPVWGGMKSNGGEAEKARLQRCSLSFRFLGLTVVASSDPTYESGEVIVFPQGGWETPTPDASEGRLSDLLGL